MQDAKVLDDKAVEVTKDTRYDNIVEFDTPAYKPRKKRFGDRKEGRRLRTLPPMNYVVPFIMRDRSDSLNYFEEVIDITNIESYIAKKHSEGYVDMSLLHVILAAYVRVVSERPAINRFVAGQRIYARNNIEAVMTVKKELSIESPDTCIKVEFDPRDNIYNVYKKFQKIVHNSVENSTDFDGTMGSLAKLPRFIFRMAMSTLRWLDYHGWLPKSLLKVSPFHGSMIITSMGSLGIPAIYHHLYNFGTLPLFLSYGSIFSDEALKRDGTSERHHFVTFRVVTDERICDGFYYASAFKKIKRYLLHPEMLDEFATEVVEDID